MDNFITSKCRSFDNVFYLQQFLEEHHVESLLDVGCGDFEWQQVLPLDKVAVTVVDSSPFVIGNVRLKSLPIKTLVRDMVKENLDDSVDDKFDAVVVRDVIQYLSPEDGRRLIVNAVRHAKRFLIVNHEPYFVKDNHNHPANQHHQVNLYIDPFDFPMPLKSIRDGNMALSIWNVTTLPKYCFPKENPSVLVAILARNKAHVLPDFLSCLYQQTFPKQQMVLYIRTNDNRDKTEEVIREWLAEHGSEYQHVEIDATPLVQKQTRPHEWDASRFLTLGRIREQSMQKTLEFKCDFYFVIDCDNFLTPDSLSHLVNLQRPIVAPMLGTIPKRGEFYSNYFCDISDNGYYKDHPMYLKYRFREKVGCFEVPVVHCTYLIQAEYIPRLAYVDHSGRYEFVIFSESARHSNVKQYICNEILFGSLLHPPDGISLEDEEQLFEDYKASNTLF